MDCYHLSSFINLITILVQIVGNCGINAHLQALKEANDYHKYGLGLINNYRCEHQVPDLTFSASLSETALSCAEFYTNDNQPKDRPCPASEMIKSPSLDYGFSEENVYTGSYSKSDTDVAITKLVIHKWYNEAENYDFDTDTVEEGKPVRNFTNMIWENMQDLGLGLYKSPKRNTFTLVALFGPPIRDFERNKKANVFPCSHIPCTCEKAKKASSGGTKIDESDKRSRTSRLKSSQNCFGLSIFTLIFTKIRSNESR